MNREPLSDEDRAVLRRCGHVWAPKRRVGRHSLHTHELSPQMRRMLRFIAHDCGMRVAFHADPIGDRVIRYLVATRYRWYGSRPPRPERKTTP